MTPEIVQIITYVLAGFSIALAITAIILFIKLKIVRAIKELMGKNTVKIKETDRPKNDIKSNINIDNETEDEGFDETIALVADENTYVNFKIIKNIIYVNTTEKIT